MNVAQHADFKIAECDAREHARLLPLNLVDNVPEQGEAIGEVARAEDMVEQAELDHNIGGVQNLFWGKCKKIEKDLKYQTITN